MTRRPPLRTAQLLFRIVLASLLALVCLLLMVAVQIVLYGAQRSDKTADTAIVLGAAAWGHRPSPVYRERINGALLLYRQGRVQRLIFTGGTREAGYPSEAEVGRLFALQHGVPAAALLIDPVSRTTRENLSNAKALMELTGLHTALLVSDPLHMKRSMAIADDLGISALPAPTESSQYRSWETWGKFLWRETWLYMEYALFGLGSEHSSAPGIESGSE